MKSALLAALFITVIAPLPAVARSLSDTHELVWHPSGKTPTMFYRLRDRPACGTATPHHQSGKMALAPRAKCASVADARTPAPDARAAVAQ